MIRNVDFAGREAMVAAMRDQHGPVFDRVLVALNSEPLVPPWWNESWADHEYLAPEAAAVLARISRCRDERDVARVVRDVFAESTFGGVASESEEHYAAVAARIWAVVADVA